MAAENKGISNSTKRKNRKYKKKSTEKKNDMGMKHQNMGVLNHQIPAQM